MSFKHICHTVRNSLFYKIQPSLAIGAINYKLEALDEHYYKTNFRLKRTNTIQHINCQLIGKKELPMITVVVDQPVLKLL